VTLPDWDAELQKEFVRQDAHDRRMALHWALRQRCSDHDNYSLTVFGRWWYTFKAIICILLRRPGDTGYEGVDSVAYWDFEPLGYPSSQEAQWTQLNVGHGILRGWVYEIVRDSSY